MGMTKKSSYMHNMQEFDRRNDERYWKKQWHEALNNQDYEAINELFRDAYFEGYEVPPTDSTDPIILGILHQFDKK